MATGVRSFAAIVATAGVLAAGIARADWIFPDSPLPDATAGVAYSFQFTVSGGSGGYVWGSARSPGPCGFPGCPPTTGLPPGFSVSQSGLLQGTPPTAGDFSFWVLVSDSTGVGAGGLYALHVRPSAAWANSTWVPVASHTSGLNGSEWRSDVWVLNPGASAADVEFDFHGAGSVVSKTAWVPGGAQVILADVVGQLGASGSGALEILSDQPLKVTSRTYNQFLPNSPCLPGGTEGQDYPGLDAAASLQAGQTAYLLGLVENASFRSNIGLVNIGIGDANVLVELFDGDGAKLADYTVPLASNEWSQAVQPFTTEARQTAVDSGYARITVQSGYGVFAFASVVDNLTNDPTTVTPPSSDGWVPVASHTSGLNGSEWRTDIGILNPGTSAAEYDVYFFGTGGVVNKTFSVAAGAQVVFKDVVGQLGASGSGALAVPSDFVTSRTYSEVPSGADCLPGGTLGQDYPVLDPLSGLRGGQVAYLPGLVENAGFRCNIGMVNFFSFPATAIVELFDASGNKLAEYTVALESHQWSQAVQPFRKLAGQAAMDGGYARITVQSGFGVFAFASVIDNVTNDPTTVTMQR
jgi:hypothetical protein